MRKWVGFYNYTVILTYIGFCIGVAGILIAMATGNTLASVCCLLLSGLCDGFDGAIASTKKDRTTDEKKFGIQIDSLSDVVCFGVLPAAIGFSAGMKKWWCFIILIAYVLAGLIRLAYYNVTEETRQAAEEGKRKYYLGVPITASCILFPALYAFSRLLSGLAGDSFYIVYAVALAVMAFLFLCPLKIKKSGKSGMAVLVAVGCIIGGLLIYSLTI